MTRRNVKVLGAAAVGVGFLVAAWAGARAQPAAQKSAPKGPDLQFKEDGDDLIVSHKVEGPASRQVIVTNSQVFDGRAHWSEPPIGVEKPRRKPSVYLRCTVLINSDLPGFQDGGLMTPPTPPFIRLQQRHEVTWRLVKFLKLDFKKEDASWHVEEQRLALSSDQWREAMPKIQKTIDADDARRKAGPRGGIGP